MSYKVSHSYITTDKIIVLYILIFKCFDSKLEVVIVVVLVVVVVVVVMVVVVVVVVANININSNK